MNVALYLRVSTTDQDPESQGREVRAFVVARGWDVIESYRDVGISGARASRPALDSHDKGPLARTVRGGGGVGCRRFASIVLDD